MNCPAPTFGTHQRGRTLFASDLSARPHNVSPWTDSASSVFWMHTGEARKCSVTTRWAVRAITSPPGKVYYRRAHGGFPYGRGGVAVSLGTVDPLTRVQFPVPAPLLLGNSQSRENDAAVRALGVALGHRLSAVRTLVRNCFLRGPGRGRRGRLRGSRAVQIHVRSF